MRTTIAATAAALTVGSMLAFAPAADAPPTVPPKDQRMAWWREARFGMFIHFGLYSTPAGTWDGKPVGGVGEWLLQNARIDPIEYEKTLVPQFNPTKFDAKEWARIAKDAGMGYVVITTKHHDGFALWNSASSDYDVMATPFKRDIMRELADAVRRLQLEERLRDDLGRRGRLRAEIFRWPAISRSILQEIERSAG